MENRNAETVKSELEGLAKFHTCPEYIKDALALINSQEQRIKELTKERNKVSEKGAENLTRLEEAHLKLEAENLKLTEENERLRADKKELINENEELKNQLQEEISEEDIDLFDEFTKLLHEGIRNAKADTVRKYREKLYRELASLGVKDKFNKAFFLTKADQIAKEMLEGEK